MGINISRASDDDTIADEKNLFWPSFMDSGEATLSDRCRVLRKVGPAALWHNFLLSNASTLAVTPSELSALLKQSLITAPGCALVVFCCYKILLVEHLLTIYL
jgi:hypothetical protein